MKKFVRIISLMLAALMLVLCLASCGRRQIKELLDMDEDERAAKLYELAGEVMDGLDSYTSEMTMSISGSVDGMTVSANGNGEMKHSDINGDNMAYCQTTYTSMKISGHGVEETETATTADGYYDGKMYISHKDNDIDQKLWSPSSVEQYREYLASKQDEEIDFKIEYFSNREAERDEDDGSWKTTLSGSNSEGLEAMKKMVGGIDEIFASTYTLKDVEVTIEYDKKYYPQSIEANYIFEVISGKSSTSLPTITIEVEYDDYNETEIEEPDFEGYTETADLAIIDKVDDAFEKIEDCDERVNFTANVLTRVSDAGNGTTYSRSSYKYTGSAYYEAENKFKYNMKMYNGDIASPTSNDIIVYTYSNGKQHAGFANSPNGQVTICTDLEAKDYIASITNYPEFASQKVQSITQKKDGVYEFTLAPAVADELKEGIEDEGAKVTSVSAVLTVTMNGDSVKSYVYTVTLDYTQSGHKLKLIHTFDVQFS